MFPQNCSSFTLSGRQCYRNAIDGTTFCNQHQHHNRGPKKQCEAITKNGSRCSYKCKDGNLCSKHKPKIPENEIKHCKGLNYNIQQHILKKCEKKCSDVYCNTHKYKYRLEKPDECPICMDEISETTEIPLECGHWIHKECLKPTNQRKCPVCRCPMKRKEIEYIFNSNHIEHDRYDENNDIQNFQSNQRNVQELQPINEERFQNNVNLLFISHSNRYNNLRYQRYNDDDILNSEDISLSSFSQIIDRDHERYLSFVDLFIYTIYTNFTVSNLDIYSYRYILNTYTYKYIKNIIMNNMNLVNSMKRLFNTVNYNIDIHISSFQIVQFEEIIQFYIQWFQN